MLLLATPPLRGACFVTLRPLLRRSGGGWLRDLDGDGAVELVIPRELELRDPSSDDVMISVRLVHPYALVDGELVLQPARAAAWYAEAAAQQEAELARERTECSSSADTEERARCEERARLSALIAAALRGAHSCAGNESDALSPALGDRRE